MQAQIVHPIIYIYTLSRLFGKFLENSLILMKYREIKLNTAYSCLFMQNSVKYGGISKNKACGNGNGENQRVFVSDLPTRNRQKRKRAATSRNISRHPFFIVLSFSVLSLIQYKKFDIIYLES